MDSLKDYIINSNLTPEELWVELNSLSETKFVSILTIEIKRYLIMKDKWLQIVMAQQHNEPLVAGLAKIVIDTLTVFSTLHYHDSEVRAKIDFMLGSLEQLGLIDNDDIVNIVALGTKKMPKVSKYGMNRIDLETIQGILVG